MKKTILISIATWIILLSLTWTGYELYQDHLKTIAMWNFINQTVARSAEANQTAK